MPHQVQVLSCWILGSTKAQTKEPILYRNQLYKFQMNSIQFISLIQQNPMGLILKPNKQMEFFFLETTLF